MKLLQKILVAVDFRPGTDDVLQAAATLAHRFDSAVLLVHVLPPMGEPSGENHSWAELAADKAAEKLEEYRLRLDREDVYVAETIVAEGAAFEQIMTHANEHDVNVVVLGSGGSWDAPPRLGATAERLCRKSNKPVWIVKPGSRFPVKSIVCPVDFSPAAQRALTNAIHLARTFDAPLSVVTVVPVASGLYNWIGGDQAEAQRMYAERHERLFEEFLGRFDFHGVQWHKFVRQGEPHREILRVAGELEADLLVMGSVGGSGLFRILLGSVAQKVLREVPCSIVTVKAEDAIRLELDGQIADLESHLNLGRQLLEKGFPQEARGQFQHCVATNGMFAPAWLGLADCYARLGDTLRAEDCRKTAAHIQETLAWKQIEAESRLRHPLWRKGPARMNN